MIGARIRAAAEKRARIFAHRMVDAYRVVNGAADSAPRGLAIDRYASCLVVWARDEIALDVVDDWCHAAERELQAAAVVLKRLARDPRKSTSAVVSGARPASPLAVREHDATFLCHLDDGIPTGLYLDHRETRLRARDFAEGAEVLNLFAYTSAFSVHAARAGATRVTSVDASKKALGRGRENMTASGLDPDAHRWFADDVRTHLDRAAKKPPRYGLVILDPPSFGRAGGHSAISFDRDISELVGAALRVTVPGGIVIVSSHTEGVSRERLIASLQSAAGLTARSLDVLPIETVPAPDFPSVGDDSLNVVFARVG
ncbi:MAG: class I SAM-dependent rRNA methyltransferase [Deltaproteobacteria bacterium]|nr:class I SAM-dependent rRNA methyltransferase [Deltaproteobacteria bacterium]